MKEKIWHDFKYSCMLFWELGTKAYLGVGWGGRVGWVWGGESEQGKKKICQWIEHSTVGPTQRIKYC